MATKYPLAKPDSTLYKALKRKFVYLEPIGEGVYTDIKTWNHYTIEDGIAKKKN